MSENMEIATSSTAPSLVGDKYQYRSTIDTVFQIFRRRRGLNGPYFVDDAHLEACRITPFYHLFRGLYARRSGPDSALKKSDHLVYSILNTWDRRTSSFIIGGKSLTVTTNDIRLLLGVEGGEDLVVRDLHEDFLNQPSGFSNRYIGNLQQCTVPKIKESIYAVLDLPQTDETRSDFVRLLVILAMSTIFYPSRRNNVATWIIQIGQDLEYLNRYNWALDIQTGLLTSLHNRVPKSVTSCCSLIPAWFFEHCPAAGDVKHPGSYPRILKWAIKQFNRNDAQQLVEGVAPDQVNTADLIITATEQALLAAHLNQVGEVEGAVAPPAAITDHPHTANSGPVNDQPVQVRSPSTPPETSDTATVGPSSALVVYVRRGVQGCAEGSAKHIDDVGQTSSMRDSVSLTDIHTDGCADRDGRDAASFDLSGPVDIQPTDDCDNLTGYGTYDHPMNDDDYHIISPPDTLTQDVMNSHVAGIESQTGGSEFFVQPAQQLNPSVDDTHSVPTADHPISSDSHNNLAAELRAHITRLQLEATELRSSLQTSRSEASNLHKAHTVLSSELIELRARLSAASADSSNTGDLHDKLARLETDLTSREAENVSLLDQISRLNSLLTQQTVDAELKNNEITIVKAQLATMSASHNALELTCADLKKRLSVAERELAMTKGALTSKDQEMSCEIAELKSALSHSELDKKALQVDNSRLIKRVTIFENAQDRIETDLAHWKLVAERTASEKTALQEELDCIKLINAGALDSTQTQLARNAPPDPTAAVATVEQPLSPVRAGPKTRNRNRHPSPSSMTERVKADNRETRKKTTFGSDFVENTPEILQLMKARGGPSAPSVNKRKRTPTDPLIDRPPCLATVAELAILDKCKSPGVVVINGPFFQVTAEAIRKVAYNGSLDDQVIDAYLDILQREHEQDIATGANQGHMGARCISATVSSFISTGDESLVDQFILTPLKKFARQCEFVLIPLHTQDGISSGHWSLLVYDIYNGEFKHYNSLKPGDKNSIGAKTNRNALDMYNFICQRSAQLGLPSLTPSQVRLRHVPSPQQVRGTEDCGVLVCMYAADIFSYRSSFESTQSIVRSSYTQMEVQNTRREIISRLISHELFKTA